MIAPPESSESAADDMRTILRQGRIAVEQHMDVFDRAGLTWHEETVTDVLLQHTWPLLRGITFNRSEEGKVGADWLWWVA